MPTVLPVAPGMFRRLVYWVMDHDWCNRADGVYRSGMPCEGVPAEKLLGEAARDESR